MERLTDPAVVKDGKRYSPIIDGNKVREHAMDLYWRLKEYEDAEEQGLLLRLRLKVGDVVWDNDWGRPYGFEITGFSFGTAEEYIDEPLKENEVIYYYKNGGISGSFVEDAIGKTVFLTKEEAEQALAEMERKNG